MYAQGGGMCAGWEHDGCSGTTGASIESNVGTSTFRCRMDLLTNKSPGSGASDMVKTRAKVSLTFNRVHPSFICTGLQSSSSESRRVPNSGSSGSGLLRTFPPDLKESPESLFHADFEGESIDLRFTAGVRGGLPSWLLL
eukprot:9498053-Pyramimonas_sp.AAC.1